MSTITLREQLLDGVPAAERRLTIAGAETVVLEGGDGPPIVLLHGPGGNATHWTRVLGSLAADHRVIAPDLPGQGASEPVGADRALGEPVFDVVAERPHTEVQSLLDGSEPKGEHYYWRSDHLSELSDGFLETFRELGGDCPIPLAQIGILHPGGALSEHEDDDGVVGNRDAQYTYGLIGAWAPDEPRADEYRQWIREGYERVRRYGSGSYINFQSAAEREDRIRVARGANHDRLMEVKRAYDPDDVFRWTRAS